MAFDAHSNFGVSSVAVAPSPSTTGTSLTVAAGEGTRFPAVPFNATLAPSGVLATPANAEIVRVTARSGDVLTITRAQEGSVARAVVVGDLCVASITAKAFQDIESGSNFPRIDVVNATPTVVWYDTNQPVDQRNFRVVNIGAFYVQAMTDTGAVVTTPLVLTRAGDVAAGRDLSEKGRSTPIGHWIDIAFAAGAFTQYGGTWAITAGNIAVNRYGLIGNTLIWSFTSTAATATSLSIPVIYLPLAITGKGNAMTGSAAYKVGAGPMSYSRVVVDANSPNRITIPEVASVTGAFDLSFAATLEFS